MILFFSILLIIFWFSIILVKKSNLVISIDRIKIDTEKNHIEYQFTIAIYVIKKIKLLSIKLNKNKIKKIKDKISKIEKSEKFRKNIETLKSKIKEDLIISDEQYLNVLKLVIKELKIQINKYNMDLKFGTSDIFATLFLITIISTILPAILMYTIYDIKELHYKIYPIYNKENILKLSLNCIITIKLVHIINIIKILNFKGRSDNYVRATSNRRSYDNCNEQY